MQRCCTTLDETKLHAHLVLGKRNGDAVGGHLPLLPRSGS